MKKSNDNLVIVTAVFIMSLLIANVVAGKVIDIYGLIVPSAVVAYGITFLCTDVISEIWGKEQATKTVKLGFAIQLSSLALIALAIKLPPAAFAADYSEMFNVVLGQNMRVVFASMTAYLIAQMNDVIIFHKLKERTKDEKKWLRNNLSTMTSQLIDTAIFITVAFYGQVPNLLWMIVSQYIIKFCIALADTPFFYYLTRGKQTK